MSIDLLTGLPVLVTGGAGFIGSHLTRALVALGANVMVLDNFSNGSMANLSGIERNIGITHGDIRNKEDIERAIRERILVFHLAALGSVPHSVKEPALFNDVNITGTLNILEAAKNAGVKRVVYSASSSAYGDAEISPKTESLLPAPKSPYAVTKLTGEYYMRAYADVFNLSTISLRYFNVFGPRQNPSSQYAAVIPAFIAALLQKKSPTIYGDGEQTRDFCFVDNVVHANLLAGSCQEPLHGQVVNIACGQSTSLNTLLAKIQQTLGTSIPPIYAPARAGDVRDSLADITAAQTLLNYAPKILLDHGLAATIPSYRKIS